MIDWTDFAGRLVWSVQQEGKHAYLRDLSRNVLRGHIKNAHEGGRRAGVPPLGYDADGDDLVIGEDAPTVRRIFDGCLSGKSLRSIARELGTTRKGVRWSANAVRVILTNPVYKGTYVWGRRKLGKYHRFVGGKIEQATRGAAGKIDAADTVVIENRYPAIVTADEWDAAQERLRSNRKQTAPKPTFVFSGLVVCGHCGGKMHGQTLWKHRYYLCVNRGAGCRYYMAREAHIEEEMLATINRVFGTAQKRDMLRKEYMKRLAKAASAFDIKAERKKLAGMDAKLSAVAERLLMLDATLLPLAQEQAKRLHEERDRLAAAIAASERASERNHVSVAGQVAMLDRWAAALVRLRSAPAESRRSYYREMIESVTVWWRTGGTDKLARHRLQRIHLSFRHPILGDL